MDGIIEKRRSIRSFTDKDVSEEQIKKILKAAMLAPSAANQQPWEFIVIDDKEILKEIPAIHTFSRMITQVNKAILVCANVNNIKYDGFWIEDCSAATQNILLKATEMGLGSVWLGVYPNEQRVKDFTDLFNLPEKIIPFSLVPIGYPAEERKTPDRYDENRVKRNKWS